MKLLTNVTTSIEIPILTLLMILSVIACELLAHENKYHWVQYNTEPFLLWGCKGKAHGVYDDIVMVNGGDINLGH